MIASNMGGPAAVAGAGIESGLTDQSVGAWKQFLESLKTDQTLRQGMLDFSQQVIQPNPAGTLGAFTSALANSRRTMTDSRQALEDRAIAEEMRQRNIGREDVMDAQRGEAHALGQATGQAQLEDMTGVQREMKAEQLTQAQLQTEDMQGIDRRLKEAKLALTEAQKVNPTGQKPSWKEQLAAAKYSLGQAPSMAEAMLMVEAESRSADPQKMLGDFLTQNILFLQKKPELLEFFTETLNAGTSGEAPASIAAPAATPTDMSEVRVIADQVLSSMGAPLLTDQELQRLMSNPQLLQEMMRSYEGMRNE